MKAFESDLNSISDQKRIGKKKKRKSENRIKKRIFFQLKMQIGHRPNIILLFYFPHPKRLCLHSLQSSLTFLQKSQFFFLFCCCLIIAPLHSPYQHQWNAKKKKKRKTSANFWLQCAIWELRCFVPNNFYQNAGCNRCASSLHWTYIYKCSH